ncbi:MAG TPA: BadF/BadG/BcrA/BcrD ATPase family protein [Acidobacteriota bacterium]|nr:BadF/BadG/BcrA/BcrD ATPase family protein [Acidobacteriota bacterium]
MLGPSLNVVPSKQVDELILGLDVGSTTVKAVVVNPATDEILWQDYQRHETKQLEKCLEFMKRLEAEFPDAVPNKLRIFTTGSGGATVGEFLGAKFVQEVNAVSLAVEKLYPETSSVIELGGQDAKIIIFKEIDETGRKKKIPSMNDKCAGGTGAVIDKIAAKLKIPPNELCQQGYYGINLHPVAGKCGVFAETDINSLQKSGVSRDEIMASLFESIIQQNLSVLTRGHTLRPVVLLLGGPNTFIKGMVECWKHNIVNLWKERNVPLPEGADPADLVRVPDDAQYFAAIGAVEFGKKEEPWVGACKGCEHLEWYLREGREQERKKQGGRGLYKTEEELQEFLKKYTRKKFVPPSFSPGEVVKGFVGIDGGSTSTKAVLIDRDKRLLLKAYQLSKGNPIEDTKDMFTKLRKQVEDQGARLEILGVGTTGYAKDILREAIGADAAIVETVAHTQAALHFYDDVDVICDVGGQDIKIIVLKEGRVKDFKLNTQCSAGNGYFLQSTAESFGIPVEKFADVAFSAAAFPSFCSGCAVFLQSDIVDFQRKGWKPEEIMAGLANVLPKNIWLYVAQIPNLAALGRKFVLQGGTQYNLAAVKAQVDFIESRFKDKPFKPEIIVHEHSGESGAIGAALEACRVYAETGRTSFIGLEAVNHISYKSTCNESTRCYFCKNKCLRTFIDVKVRTANPAEIRPRNSKVPLEPGTTRLIIATCEKGTVEDVNDMRAIKQGLDRVKDANPNMAEIAARTAWQSWKPERVADPIPKYAITPGQRRRVAAMKRRDNIRIGIPRVLNMYSLNPLFSAYFESLGIKPTNLVYSDFTDTKLYREGAKRGSIDPCFPSKVAIPHIHNLLFEKHEKSPLDYIFFPMIDDLPSPLQYTQGCRACPTVATTPEAVKAAFIKEGDLFAEKKVVFLDTFVNPANPGLFKQQMFAQFRDILGLSREESDRAVDQGYQALDKFLNQTLRKKAREVLDQLAEEQRVGIVLLGRPYHNDPGINHEILEEFQKAGYPVFTLQSLPLDEDLLEQMFGEEVESGVIRSPLDISDAWKNSYSENTSYKIWGAKFTARHPNLVALELSSFKCGHDAPIYSVVEEIIEKSGTPYFSFKDIDENKPTGSFKIRVETIDYFLKRYQQDMRKKAEKERLLNERLKAFESELRKQLSQSAPSEAGEMYAVG